jgi:hypothetical protein
MSSFGPDTRLLTFDDLQSTSETLTFLSDLTSLGL